MLGKSKVKITDITKYFKFEFDKQSRSDVSPFTKLLKRDYVETFYIENSQNRLMFHWKGRLRTFKEIVEIVTYSGKPLDHPSFVRYVNLFQIFVVSTLFWHMIDTLEFFLIKYVSSINDFQYSMFSKSAEILKSLTLPECFVPAANALADVKDFKNSVTLIENKIILKHNLKLCGLYYLPNSIVTEYNEERWVLFKDACLYLTEYYNSVILLQTSFEYQNHYVEKLDTYLKLTHKVIEYSGSIDDIYQTELPKPEAVERMLEEVLMREPLSPDSDNADSSKVVIS